jgi:MFS family permease
VLIGPLLGAGLIHVGGLTWVFWLAAAMSLTSALLARTMPDFGSEHRGTTAHLSVVSVLKAHRRTLLTLGVAVVIIAASRSLRTGLLPLWAEHVGLSASTTSLIFACAAAVDIAFFFPGGWLMDNYGRFVVAVPVVATTAIGCLFLPLATSAVTVGAAMVVMAIGNGLGSGIVMTLGADTAPVEGRAQYLGGWRLCGDIGISGGALLVTARRRLPRHGRGRRSRDRVGRLLHPPGRSAEQTASQPTVTTTSLENTFLSVSITRNLFAPPWLVCT